MLRNVNCHLRTGNLLHLDQLLLQLQQHLLVCLFLVFAMVRLLLARCFYNRNFLLYVQHVELERVQLLFGNLSFVGDVTDLFVKLIKLVLRL